MITEVARLGRDSDLSEVGHVMGLAEPYRCSLVKDRGPQWLGQFAPPREMQKAVMAQPTGTTIALLINQKSMRLVHVGNSQERNES